MFDSPHGNAYEKNWMPFTVRGETRWVYSGKPDHVVMGPTGAFSTPNPFPWTGGVVRGGAPPVLVERPGGRPAYYHFFHGCLKRPHGNVYTVGCNVFEPHPPFRVLRQTPTPLVWPDLPGPGEPVVKRYVVFPGGAILRGDTWHVACGIDDTFCRIHRLPFADVEAALADVPEGDTTVTSIRETAINTGVRRGE